MSSTPEDGIQVTLYEAPPDTNGMLRAKDEIIAKLTVDIAQANADKDDLQASFTQKQKDNAIKGNIIDEQDVKIIELESKLHRLGEKYRDVKRERDVFDRALDRSDYENAGLKKEVSENNRKLNDKDREIEGLETEIVIFQRVIDEDNASTSSDSSATDYDMIDRTSEEEDDEDINGGNGIFSATDDNGSYNSSAANVKSEDEAMDDI